MAEPESRDMIDIRVTSMLDDCLWRKVEEEDGMNKNKDKFITESKR